MHEYVVNLHMHTRFSDGTGTHAQIADAAINAGLDCIIITDHNVRVNGIEGYLRRAGRKLIILVGEEVHDQNLQPQKNHLLVLGVDAEMAQHADQPQQLINRVQQAGGLSFIAHPEDQALPLINEEEIPWKNWEVENFTGIELWNGLSEFKSVVHNWLDALRLAFNPDFMAHAPTQATLQRYDSLLAKGKRIVAVGSADAHGLRVKVGPISRTIFPYPYHFEAINTHLLTAEPLTGNNFAHDRKVIYSALERGNCFIGYDLPAPTRGFRFTAQTSKGVLTMGDQGELRGTTTLQVKLPFPAECRLLQDGRVIKIWKDQLIGAHITKEPGIYRVEATIPFLGRQRGWIYSNPIYLHPYPMPNIESTGPQWSQTTLPAF